jgi:inosine-uridine nucleoside N-ribohydrolase
MSHPSSRPRPLAALVALLATAALATAACLGSTPAASPVASARPAAEPRPIIVDADMDISDLTALAVLLRDPAVDVRAIAIDGTGLVHCDGGLRVTAYLLAEFGATDIPYGCGREAASLGGRPFPADWRATADDAYGLDVGSAAIAPTSDAVTVIRDAVDASPVPPTIVALGPLTNLHDAFAADPTLPDRLAGIHAMLGAVDGPGNVMVDDFDADDRLEWNAFADPAAVAAVFATDVPIDLIPLDATDDVPVPADLAERLEADHAAAGADLLLEAIRRFPARLNADEGQQLWDELAALTVSAPDLVTWADADVVVGPRGGLTRDDGAGRPVRFASAADRPAVETALLDALRRGGPRTSPFTVAGTFAASFDGTTCRLTADTAAPGFSRVTFAGSPSEPSGVMLAGVRAPKAWTDLEAFLEMVDLTSSVETAVPDWIVQGAQLFQDDPAAGLISAFTEVEAGVFGPVCVTGTWPDLRFVVGQPIVVGG